MRAARHPLALVVLVGLGLLACRPDVPGRDCKTNADCFTHEVCTNGTCADAPVSGGAGGAGGAGGTAVGGTPVGGAPVGGMPTGGTARVTGGLSVFTFLRVRTWLAMDTPAPLARDAAALARLEGLEAHARSAEKRLPE